MTSQPPSRNARATTFAPRSWPSRPGLAMRTRIFVVLGAAVIGISHWALGNSRAAGLWRGFYRTGRNGRDRCSAALHELKVHAVGGLHGDERETIHRVANACTEASQLGNGSGEVIHLNRE